MPSLPLPAQAANRACLSSQVGAEFFLGSAVSHQQNGAAVQSHISPHDRATTIAAHGAQARDDLSNQFTDRNSFIHGGMDR
ncbi:peptide subunit release factor 1 (eRF1) [Sphingobium sp. B1D7B]|uniref:hypothetical protein n=1 Tax=Sphingobium sp. B1D7B TaxID=2940578 RepID=UPI00222511FB|nr:hypothetical protein [Sphingobium sp. B1D7B]MCW2405062.1 peptide subunit release factor 1 (eRF1) [Sphingobium sp. B1D7B]